MAILTIALFAAPAVAPAGPDSGDRRAQAEAKAQAEANAHAEKRRSEGAAAIPLNWEQYVLQRRDDIVEINTRLYVLSNEERANLDTIAEKFTEGAFLMEEKESSELMRMVEERGMTYRKYLGESGGTPKERAALEARPEILKLNIGIAQHEGALTDAASINQFCESIVGPERTAEAHAQWKERMLRVRGRIATTSLLEVYAEPNLLERLENRSALDPATPKPQPMTPVRIRPQNRTRRATSRDRTPAGEKDATPPAHRRPRARAGKSEMREVPKPDKRRDSRRPAARNNRPDPQPPKRSAPKPVPLDEWERYVRDFLQQYKCTPEQSNSALSILAELKERADRHKRASARQIASAEQIGDRRKRQERLDQINAPIGRLFDQLKHRLDGLLTTEQRAMKPEPPKRKHR